MYSPHRPLHIVGLGSSFAAGPLISPQVGPSAARRSGRNYAHSLAGYLAGTLVDISASGATLLNITVEPQHIRFPRRHTFPPQISQIPECAGIITLTAGGNDIGYIGDMTLDALSATLAGKIFAVMLRALRFVGLVSRRTVSEDTAPLMSAEELSIRLGDTLDMIHAKAPKAHVFLVEYLAVLGPSTRPFKDVPFTQERIDYHRAVASKLQQAYVLAAESRKDWCDRIPVHEASQGHALGSDDPWVGGFGFFSLFWENSRPVFHPNAVGMGAIAKMLLERIGRQVS
ncbi:hypothetical protein PT974_07488 [Cladobotryum mycophilum]|uniref:SGNH hydrolase-type esterase domain-containing protein n=1 Tax=Cladobotryum mycophilum TaxID=491253 RepID=A0ABR0SPE0_9HYPO